MRNRTLDMVKAICAYAVVLLHVHFPGNAGIIANVLARFAVPVFFMVSGYFCFRGDDTEFIRTGKKDPACSEADACGISGLLSVGADPELHRRSKPEGMAGSPGFGGTYPPVSSI